MNSDQIRLSVALVTRNRPDSLERTLKSLRAQDVQPWEVIVSDDSDEEHAAAVAALANKYQCRYLSGPKRGLYANRNHVAAACEGTHIRTMDDDHEFPEHHIQDCLDAIFQDQDCIWAIGEYAVMKKEVAHRYQSIKQYIIIDNYTPDKVPAATVPCPGQLNAMGISEVPPDPQNCWAISDGASIIPKAVFDKGIRYVEHFLFGASYLEFGSRLHWMGYRMRHLASTYVAHYSDPSERSFMNADMDLSSRIFAMLCHSHIYQPNKKNKATSLLILMKYLLFHKHHRYSAIKDGWGQYIKQKEKLTGQ